MIRGMETLFDPVKMFLRPEKIARKCGISVCEKYSLPGMNWLYGRSDVSRNRTTKAPARA